MNNTTESVTLFLEKSVIDTLLSLFAPDTSVVGSLFTEDGWILILEGDINQISTFLLWAKAYQEQWDTAYQESV